MKLIMDFYQDLSNYLRLSLVPPNFKIDPGTEPDEVIMRFLNWFRRRISSKPRVIHRSKEFVCPTTLEQPLMTLEEKVRNGDDLNTHLSKRLTLATKENLENDLMINISKVHHFHLGESIGSDGYVQRTGPLLFALVTDSDFYEINIYGHVNHWTDSNISEIVRENWPKLIDSCGNNYIEGWDYKTTDKESLHLGKCGINDFTRLSTGVFGGGIATTGRSLCVVTEATLLRRVSTKLEQLVEDKIYQRLPESIKSELDENENVEVKLHVDDSAGIVCAFLPRFDIRIELS